MHPRRSSDKGQLQRPSACDMRCLCILTSTYVCITYIRTIVITYAILLLFTVDSRKWPFLASSAACEIVFHEVATVADLGNNTLDH